MSARLRTLFFLESNYNRIKNIQEAVLAAMLSVS